MARGKKGGFWHFVENFEGDKVVWMIVLLLMMISLLAISSSTPLLALQTKSSRTAIINEQLIVEALGLGFIILIYNIRSITFIRRLSSLGFALSFFLLLFLDLHLNLGGIKALYLNKAYRSISVFGFQLHVFEVVKIAMVMYLAWAVNAFNKDKLTLANWLAKQPHFEFMAKPIAKKVMYLYGPVLLVCVMVVGGSMSSAIFIGLICGLTIMVGGISIKELIPILLVGIVLLFGCIGIYKISDGKAMTHIGSAVNRVRSESPEKRLEEAIGTKDFQDVLDDVKQPISAKVAVSEGGFKGKGPGGSTQRYVVPVMFEDYMFAFIIEEYGILGALFVMILYASLLARGSFIVKNCDNLFAKTAIAGLVLAIAVQAVLHMFVNVGCRPYTGQTLPMISHGNTSFIMFSIAFGIILSISRMAKKKMEKETEKAEPLVAEDTDDLGGRMDDLDELDNL